MGLRSQNNPIASFRDVFSRTGKDATGAATAAGGGGHTATGGVISDYVVGSDVYRAHVFTSSGTFDVQTLGSTSTVDITTVAGGGGGSGSITNYWAGCGGGGGGMIEVSDYPISNLTYPIVVGGGGSGSGPQEPGALANTGSDSRFNNPANNSIDVVSRGGGAGGGSSNSPDNVVRDGTGGGSCGGVGSKNGLSPLSGPAINTHPNNPTIAGLAGVTFNHYGNVGGTGDDSTVGEGSGGGGAGGAGTGVSSPKSTGHNNPGGAGRANTYAYGPTSSIMFSAGGGAGPTAGNGDPAAANTGGGGGGGANPNTAEVGGTGGSGMVIVRYKIGTLEATAKATGGAISFYNGKTIHTFLTSGSFDNSAQITDAEFVLVGGGGGGGYPQGGGGGAGGMVVHTGPFTIPGPATNAVVVGGGGAGLYNGDHPANPGTTTTLTFPGTPVTYSAYRGGGSGPAALGAMNGGSGGGGSYNNGAGKPGTNPAPNPGAIEYGNAGANHVSPSNGGGGGGAGASGSGSLGGEGRQLPTTYRNPVSAGSLGTPGPDPGGFYVAGGGSAFYGPTGTPRDASAGGGGGGPITFPTPQDSVRNSMNGKANTGGGGAGPYMIAAPNTYAPHAGNGASGIVLIAYPT